MTKIIFEDNLESPISQLLKSSYNGENISFSGGGDCSKMMLLVNKFKLEDIKCRIFIFYDLPPNNKDACENYDKLCEAILQREYENIYVIPIICIELITLKFLVKYNYINLREKDKALIDNLITRFDYQNEYVHSFCNKNEYRSSSLEHVYKDLLAYLVDKCKLNKFEYTDTTKSKRKLNSKCGIFYESDCVCDRRMCKVNVSDSLHLKAERLYLALPISACKDEKHESYLKSLDIVFKRVDIQEVLYKVIENINQISDSMGVRAPIIYTKL